MDYKERYAAALKRARDLMTKQNPPAFNKDLISLVFPELKESEDEMIRKWLIDWARAVNWSEQFTITKEQVIAWLEKQGEQKPADNVEPKFKVGDWLCENEPNNYARFIQILEIVNIQGKERYRISRDIHNDEDIVEFSFVEKYYHKFDISDAKYGDALAFIDHERVVIGIVSFVNEITGKVDVSCLLEDNKFKIGNFYALDTIKPHPATKEQYEYLFQKMKEAGYEWDNEKKGLRKIEQKPADKVEPKFKVGDTKAVGSVRAFSSVYSHDKVREIDDRIMKAQKKYNARVQKAMANAKDFVITH